MSQEKPKHVAICGGGLVSHKYLQSYDAHIAAFHYFQEHSMKLIKDLVYIYSQSF